MTKDELQEIYMNDDYEEIESTLVSTWRFGTLKRDIIKLEDETYYKLNYRVSSDGETHGVVDGEFTFSKVTPITETITITKYITVKE